MNVTEAATQIAETSEFSNIDANAGLAFGLVICAGLSTAVGAAAVYFKGLVQLASKSVLAAGLGFSGGVMLYVSFVEIFVKSVDSFAEYGHKENNAAACATVCFFSGVVAMKLLSILVHRIDSREGHELCIGGVKANEASTADIETSDQVVAPAKVEPEFQLEASKLVKDRALQQMGLSTALAIALHNFPEGLATFVATLADPIVGATLAVAIAIHNVPEGLCVALPIYYATDNRHKGFAWALLSGLSEPIGALIGYVIIKSTGEDMNMIVYGILFGMVAGMMVAIVIYDLIPTGMRYDSSGKYLANSVVVGMFVMALSLVMFQY